MVKTNLKTPLNMSRKFKIPIYKPYLPKKEAYFAKINRIWKDRMLSNFHKNAQQMEKLISKYLRTNNVFIVSGADIGLIISLSVLNLKAGDEVIVSSYTFNSTANSILWNGLTPVFADIDRNTLTIDPNDVERKITPKTRAIIGTHVFGNPCKVEELRNIANKFSLHLLFDAAASFGSCYKNKKAGTLGDIEVMSFSGTKVISSAEGGVIVVRDAKLLKRVIMARNYGFIGNYNTGRIGINGKISEFNAALGCLNLPKINTWVSKRNRIAKKYINLLKNVGDISFQQIEKDCISTYNDFVILTEKSNSLQNYLSKAGVQTIKYFFPIHRMDLYQKYYKTLPVTDEIYNNCLCLPIYNEIREEEVEFVAKTIKKYFSSI